MARAPRPRGRSRVDHRRSASQRGYDGEWNKLARSYRREHPLCEHCLRGGRTTAASLVDHVIPIRGPHDPRRLDWGNLQSLCRSCHTLKTGRERGTDRDAGAGAD
jgi:5-methylcytosine-specific restriction protein A